MSGEAAPLGFRLDGRAGLVTGAAGGIGAAAAKALAAAGADIALNDLAAGGGLAASAAAVRAVGRRAIELPADVGDEAAVERMFDEALRVFGRLDALVHCAAVNRGEDVFSTSLASWNEVLRVNLTGTFLCARAAMRRMRESGGGRIVLLGSVVGHQGSLPGVAHYAASKGGIHALARTLARSGASHRITVNAIAPGLVDTEMLRVGRSESDIAAIAARAPLGLADPADIAAAAVYLASDAGRHLTGAVLDVNGGFAMR